MPDFSVNSAMITRIKCKNLNIRNALRNLVPFLRFKERKKAWVFFPFFNLRKCYKIAQSINQENKKLFP